MSPSEVAEILTVNGIRYRRCEPPPPTNRGVTRSVLWSHGDAYVLGEVPDIIAVWRCHFCKDLVKLWKGMISNAKQHMDRNHKHQMLSIGATYRDRTPSSSPSVVTPSQSASQVIQSVEEERDAPRTKREVGQLQLTSYLPKVDRWRDLLLRWCIEKHIPFSSINVVTFKEMLMSVNPSIERYLFTAQTLSRWAEEDCYRSKEEMKRILKDRLSKVHISFDMWTTPSMTYAFLGIMAHFVIRRKTELFDLRNQTALLALRRVEDKHSGEQMGKIIVEILREYEIVEALGVFVADNAESNNTAIKHVLSVLDPSCKDPNTRRSRCIAHIINLAAKAFLFGSDTRAFEHDIEGEEENINSDRLKVTQTAWRKKGALGKLHNIVMYVRASVQRREAFENIKIGRKDVDGLTLQPDNQTRWNSHYHSIERALRLKDRLTIYINQNQEDLKADALSEGDWDHLREVHSALALFADTTTYLESNAQGAHHGCVWEWLPAIECFNGGNGAILRRPRR